jgi:hypothetical protein
VDETPPSDSIVEQFYSHSPPKTLHSKVPSLLTETTAASETVSISQASKTPDDFKLLGVIGSGSFGDVFKVQDLTNN